MQKSTAINYSLSLHVGDCAKFVNVDKVAVLRIVCFSNTGYEANHYLHVNLIKLL